MFECVQCAPSGSPPPCPEIRENREARLLIRRICGDVVVYCSKKLNILEGGTFMNETLKTLIERRSCRAYKDDPIPAEILDRIL